jgi:hypothetical protein
MSFGAETSVVDGALLMLLLLLLNGRGGGSGALDTMLNECSVMFPGECAKFSVE